ncbi:hypothetical protein CKO17_11355 [Marichromatium gracile]|nr:hypothetical protein [Marichromatium gracile]
MKLDFIGPSSPGTRPGTADDRSLAPTRARRRSTSTRAAKHHSKMNSPDFHFDQHPGQVGTPPYTTVLHASGPTPHHAPRIPNTTPEVLVCIDAQEQIVICDHGVEPLFGHSPEALRGNSWKHLVAHQSQQRLSDLLQQVDTSPHPDGIDLGQAGLLGQHQDGALFPLDGRILPARSGASGGYTLVLRPAPRRDDGRDHCPEVERPHLIDQLDRALQQHRRLNRSCALLVIDIALGRHHANPAHTETMMQACIQRLQHGRRRQDRLARFGASRLALLLSEITGVDKVERVVERLRTTLSQPVESAGGQHRPSPRIGFACYPEDAICPATLLDHGERSCTERHRPPTILVS